MNTRSTRFNTNDECNIEFKLRKLNPSELCEDLVSGIPNNIHKLEGKIESTIDILNKVKVDQEQAKNKVLVELSNFDNDNKV